MGRWTVCVKSMVARLAGPHLMPPYKSVSILSTSEMVGLSSPAGSPSAHALLKVLIVQSSTSMEKRLVRGFPSTLMGPGSSNTVPRATVNSIPGSPKSWIMDPSVP
eukprot:gnl/TRDRNA2_/TRDRNA2_183017_c0_seq1.p2 gnl/TRDRNA2_/TRDRNA2_183017_c0~~gnl/TRDRNA2_/TRDRNA2_183017_c0_seq1.p2  ORF type:complete len:106 (-),score=8.07 gnl/TRDRNA2_/TRDRNA2_183017_c0_seq1:417-734(-)